MRAEIGRLAPWHHDLEIAPGVRTGEGAGSGPGAPSLIRPDLLLAGLVADLFPDGLAGRSLLDCACNAGGYLFAAARLGAGRGFGFDARGHWIAQARFLARHLPADDLDFAVCELADLPGLGLEPFDLTLFNGIFYHLPDPVAGLRKAADLTRELIVVNTTLRRGRGDALVLNKESREAPMSGVDGLAWLPNGEPVLREILGWCGFPHVRLRSSWPIGGRNWRAQLVAAREGAALAHYDSVVPARRGGPLVRIASRLAGRPVPFAPR